VGAVKLNGELKLKPVVGGFIVMLSERFVEDVVLAFPQPLYII